MSGIIGVTKVDTSQYQAGSVKKTSGGNEFASYLGETKSMDAIFTEASDKYNVPAELLKAVGKAESNFNPNAVSRCGAQGVMQLMPGTAKELGVTDAFDAEQNIMGGAKYISGLLKKYEGNTKLALAAYNAGSGNVAKYNGIPPFEETQNYVKKVMGFSRQGNIEIASEATGRNNRNTQTAMVAPIQRELTVSGNTDGSIDALDSVFSYEDYMKFLELLLKEENDKAEEKNEDNKSNYSAGEITYNSTVMNLMKEQNLI